jgi:Bacterial SH3 domain
MILLAESRLRRFQRSWARRFFVRPAKSVVFAGVVAFGRRFQRSLPATPTSVLCVLALIAATPGARAEQVYVIEQLVVAVASEPGGEGERIGQVKSGDKLDLIERQGEEAHIRLANGKEGWIKGSYVSAEQPLTSRLSERSAEVDKLKQDVSRLQSELASARTARNSAPAQSPPSAPGPMPASSTANNLPDPPPAAPAAVSDPRFGRDAVFLRSPDQSSETPWAWVLGTSAVMLLAGFAIGWRTLDRRIRRKYGGLRIY